MTNKENLLCSKCKTGMNDFSLDKKSDMCTYIACLKDGKCCMFASLTNEEDQQVEKKI